MFYSADCPFDTPFQIGDQIEVRIDNAPEVCTIVDFERDGKGGYKFLSIDCRGIEYSLLYDPKWNYWWATC